MKKSILTIASIAIFGLTSLAQKPAAADVPMSLEGVINFSGSSLEWQAPTIRYRYFLNDNLSGRIQLGLGDGLGTPMSESYMFREYTNVDSTLTQGSYDIKRSSWNAQIGGEYHLDGTDRISPYFMFGVNIGGGSETHTTVDSDMTDYVEGLDLSAEGKMSMFGVGLGAGLDIYLIENLYMGFELGLNFNSVKYGDYNETSTFTVTSGGTTTTTVTSNTYDGYKMTSMNTGAGSAAIRLGWRF